MPEGDTLARIATSLRPIQLDKRIEAARGRPGGADLSRVVGRTVTGVAAKVVHFNEILEDLETNCRFATARVERAKVEIRGRAREFWDRYEIRPFGWEDLCA